MATTTTNFGWDIPQSTDLVKDGATAIAALGQDIDTALIDLKGGTTGQVLAKASNTDLDYSWVAQDDSNAIQNALLTTTGDTIYASSASTPARRAIGTTGQVLTVSGGIPVWANPAGAALPAFSAYGSSNQSPTVNVWTKITFNTEVFDTASNFDTTNSRFLPTTAGYYQINGTLNMEITSSGAQLFAIYKNGSLDKYLSQQILSGERITSGSATIYLNGSSDYVELYGRGTAGTVTFYAGITATHFTGVGVRA